MMSNAANDENVLQALPVELLSHILTFLPVKDVSTFHGLGHVDAVKGALMEIQSITNCAPTVIQKLWREEFDKWSTAIKTDRFASISAVFALLEYVAMAKRLSSEELKGDEDKQQFCWPVALSSRVGESELSEPSEVIFSTPYFDPKLLVLSEEWLSPESKLCHGFPLREGLVDMNPERNLGVLSWTDGRLLTHAHKTIDLDAGMEAWWEHRSALLMWMSKASREIYPNAEALVESCNNASWLLKNMEFDNHMLCFWEEDDGFEDISVSNEEVIQRIQALVLSLDKHQFFQ